MDAGRASRRFLGITVLGDFVLSEGVEAVLANVRRAGATAVATNPTVTAPAAEGQGSFQPPSDAGTSPRVFDRPLFGRRSSWVRSGPSYVPRTEFYRDCPYAPRQPNDLTQQHGQIIAEFIFRPDWPEYPCYTFDEVFQDFGPHVARWAAGRGLDFEGIQRDVARVYNHLLGSLTNDDLREASGTASASSLFELLEAHGLAEWLRLKSELVADLLMHWREIIDEAGGSGCRLPANAFMPPWAVLTGFCQLDPSGRVALADEGRVCDAIAPKLYTMHWSLMVEFWGRALLAANPGLDERLVVRTLVKLLDLTDEDGRGGVTLADYGYPEPDEAHPIPDAPQRRKIEQMIAAAGGRAAVWPLVHGYGPVDDFARRLRLVAESAADGAWINRYGYLSDAKIERIADVWQ